MRRVTIPAREKTRFRQEVVVILGDDIEHDYEVLPEEFPDELPTTWTDVVDRQEKTINWVSNFRLEKRAGVEQSSKRKVFYQIELDRGGETLVAFDGSSLQELTTRNIGKNRVQADLQGDDPAIGWV